MGYHQSSTGVGGGCIVELIAVAIGLIALGIRLIYECVTTGTGI